MYFTFNCNPQSIRKNNCLIFNPSIQIITDRRSLLKFNLCYNLRLYIYVITILFI